MPDTAARRRQAHVPSVDIMKHYLSQREQRLHCLFDPRIAEQREQLSPSTNQQRHENKEPVPPGRAGVTFTALPLL